MTLVWIITSGFLMSCIALVGAFTLLMKKETLDKILMPLVAFAAGSLIGGALLHMLPAAVGEMGNSLSVYLWLIGGFLSFNERHSFLGLYRGDPAHRGRKSLRARPLEILSRPSSSAARDRIGARAE